MPFKKPDWLGPERYRITAYKGVELVEERSGFAADEDLHWFITECLYVKATKIMIEEVR
jgi:hypothetical protein